MNIEKEQKEKEENIVKR